MKEREIQNRLNGFERELALAGDDILEMRRVFRAAVDAVELEIRAVWHCLYMLHPDQKEKIMDLKESVLRDTDPEMPPGS